MRPRPQIFEKTPEQVKNIGIWFRYDSRTGTHNAYKEYREVSLTNAVNSLYQNMAGLSRAKAASIQILKTAELKPAECKRPNIKQFHVRSCPPCVRETERSHWCCLALVSWSGAHPALRSYASRLSGILTSVVCASWPSQDTKVKFPLAHRVIKTPKMYRTTFKASTAKTFFG